MVTTSVEQVEQLLAEHANAVRVPTDEDFKANADDFLDARGAAVIGEQLVAECNEFAFLQDAKIRYLWKREGGESHGRATLGKCQKPSGLLRHFALADFVIWLAADHARERHITHRQLEAMVYHELCHCDVRIESKTGEADKVTWILAAHDVEAFSAEVRKYGLWRDDLKEFGVAVRQLSLAEAG